MNYKGKRGSRGRGRRRININYVFRTQYLGLGSYEEWDEEKRQHFLSEELKGRRPLIPSHFPCTGVL